MPYYNVRHHTRYRYDAFITESVMEVRMQPRTDEWQRCINFSLVVLPTSRALNYGDIYDNQIHFFTIPGRHSELFLRANATVEVRGPAPLPADEDAISWADVDEVAESGIFWDWLRPSHFARPTPLLGKLAREVGLDRSRPPLETLRHLNGAISRTFAYVPQSTQVDSPIDEALTQRQGVCQDFAHITIALARQLGLPCRYVSGYLFHRAEDQDRSQEDASHAWVEAYLPTLGWLGLDPTNNIQVTDRHIRVAVGRDYADVPPTRGVYKGETASHMEVGVQVFRADRPEPKKQLLEPTEWVPPSELLLQQQQQQQQQQ
jgi:transglutaminase-like putative cysteine protease